jgi:hypothetical protein
MQIALVACIDDHVAGNSRASDGSHQLQRIKNAIVAAIAMQTFLNFTNQSMTLGLVSGFIGTMVAFVFMVSGIC